jgi:hypothetical protein
MKVIVNPVAPKQVVSVGIQGPAGSTAFKINEAQDMDITDIRDGSVLVYKSITQKWTATKTLEAQAIEGGQY